MVGSKFAVLSLLLVLLCFSFVSAKPPGSTTNIFYFDDGYTIIDNPQNTLKQHQDYQVNFFVRNTSSGLYVDNITTNCTLFIAGDNGTVLLADNVLYYPDGHWGYDINGSVFNKVGVYGYGINCIRGSLSGAFDVTTTGYSWAFSLWIFLSLLITGIVFFLIAYLTDNEYIGFISGILFIIGGMYVMIYGLGMADNLYTKVLSLIVLSLGIMVFFASAFHGYDNGDGLFPVKEKKDKYDYFTDSDSD